MSSSPLFVDTQVGSCDLVEPLRKLHLDIVPTRLESGDLMFEGRGVKGAPVLVGIEFKKLGELIDAFRSARLQGFQVPRMRETYQQSYLLIEGQPRYTRKGQLCHWQSRRGRRQCEVLPGRMTIGELLRRLAVLHLCTGIVPWFTTSRADTLQVISALYHTWTDVDLDEHKSHLELYVPPTASFIASPAQVTFRTFPDLGMRFSKAAERYFHKSITRAANASVEEWAALVTTHKGKTRRLGAKAAQRIVQFCQGEQDDVVQRD